jgi:hypothetical protein
VSGVPVHPYGSAPSQRASDPLPRRGSGSSAAAAAAAAAAAPQALAVPTALLLPQQAVTDAAQLAPYLSGAAAVMAGPLGALLPTAAAAAGSGPAGPAGTDLGSMIAAAAAVRPPFALLFVYGF